MKTRSKAGGIKILTVGLAVGALAVSVWAFRGERSKAAARTTPQNPMAAIPAMTGSTPTDKEIAKWQKLIPLNEKDPLGWTSLGDALMQKARETADVSYYTLAEKQYQKALELNPNAREALIGMAWVTSVRHEFEQSIEWANKTLARDPNNNMALGLLGDAAVEMGNYEKAMDHYQAMLDSRPDISSYSRGAHLLFLTGDVNRANLLMLKAVRAGAPFAENTAWCRAQLATYYLKNGLVQYADKLMQETLKQTPDNYHARLTMGRVKAAKKDFAGAIAELKKAVAVAPQIEALVELGDLYRLTGKADEAQTQYAQVEAIHQLQKANGIQGEIQIAQFWADHDRNLPEALKQAEAEYKTRKNVYAADTLAWCRYKNGKYAEAREAIDAALKQKTPEARFLFHAGLIYAKLNLQEDAQQYLSRALNLNPHFHIEQAKIAAETLQQLGTRVTARTSHEKERGTE
jgi:tetratricopeptide (TPR) repeat protein